MSFFRRVLPHATLILSAFFALLLILNDYNPAMNFIGSPLSLALLAALCACAFATAILAIRSGR